MRTFDTCCKIVGGIGAAFVAGGLLYVAVVMTFGLFDLPPPPRILWAGIMLILASGASYAAAHLIRGDL